LINIDCYNQLNAALGAETMSEPIYVSAREAAAELNISRATLYAYVSRGLIESVPRVGQKRRAYALSDVRALLRDRGHSATSGTTSGTGRHLDFGGPVLDSALCTISDGRLFYRGRDAAALAEATTLESVAGLLWDSDAPVTFAPPELAETTGETSPGITRAIRQLSLAATTDPLAHGRGLTAVIGAGSAIVGAIAASFGASSGASSGACAGGTIDQALAEGWDRPDAARVLRAALILAADHELNASTFVVRCVASTNASPYGAVVAGLSALQGPRHGGQTLQVAAFLDEAERARTPGQAVADRLARGDTLPGFGHPLYPAGDIRAATLLRLAQETGGAPEALGFCDEIQETARAMTGEFPNLDFALVTLARAFALPATAPFGLFATGRAVGWIAHAREQYADPRLIRPRARYTGEEPRPAHNNRGG
jgi:citrate synthase